MPVKRQHQGSTSTSRKKTKVVKSVWNSTDDWTTLVADSSLSTSSISTRRPRPRGLQTLVICCQEAAIRSFKILWEARGSSSTGTDGRGMGREWREKWQFVPDHLKYRVRDGVFSRWGHLLTIAMIHDVFLVPPEIYLPAGELPAIAETKHLKPLFPSEETRNWYTSLVLTHAAKPSDVSVAGLIHHLPELQTINLKGCSLVETKTVETILKRSVKLRKINLKGTKVGERHVKALLETFGDQMETFKVDKVIFNNPNETFPSSYPSITHLCLPGAILHGPHTSTARFLGRTNYPKPRPIHPESHFTFPRLPILFPNITHLYLSGLLIPPNIEMIFPPNQLQKLVLGPNGPPVPIPVLVSLLKNQEQSLRSIHLGNLAWVIRKDEEDQLIGVLDKCRKMKNFEIEKEHDVGLELLSVILAIVFFGSWRGSLKVSQVIYLHFLSVS
ncbi:hypothetical protein M231_02694 [Tremella mesenterica]|uniref:Uncharacterized protein n=1 Tax=Tremella mesenterica TaxID=5217 RepID=A0A4Q1BQ59_TREME|nr:hypothetical protein M231_02694 [Tremella mesenterica]